MNGVEARTCLLRATKCRNGRLDRREAPDTKVNLNEEMGSYTSCGWCIAAGDVLKFGRGVERLGRLEGEMATKDGGAVVEVVVVAM
jgi:hypothetical protein